MVELRCNMCGYLRGDFCEKLEVLLPNGLAKLFYGGATGSYTGGKTYPSKCEIEKEIEGMQRIREVVLIPEKDVFQEYLEPQKK